MGGMPSIARPHNRPSGDQDHGRIQDTIGSGLRGKQTLFIAVAWCINVLAYSIVYPFLPIYLHAIRGFPMSMVGLIFPVMGLAAIVGSPISGWLADRAGRRALLIGGPIGRSGAFFLLAGMAAIQAPFVWFVAGLFFASLLGKFFQNAANADLTDMLPPEERLSVGEMLSLTAILTAVSQIAPANMVGRYMGVHGLVDGLGWAIGPYIGALLFEQFHGQSLLLWALLSIFSSAAGVGFFIIVRYWQTTPPERKALA